MKKCLDTRNIFLQEKRLPFPFSLLLLYLRPHGALDLLYNFLTLLYQLVESAPIERQLYFLLLQAHAEALGEEDCHDYYYAINEVVLEVEREVVVDAQQNQDVVYEDSYCKIKAPISLLNNKGLSRHYKRDIEDVYEQGGVAVLVGQVEGAGVE